VVEICVVCRAFASTQETPENPEKTIIFEKSADHGVDLPIFRKLVRRSADVSEISFFGVFGRYSRVRLQQVKMCCSPPKRQNHDKKTAMALTI